MGHVVWVVEREGVMGTTNTGRLLEALDELGIPRLSVDPKYFTDDLPEVVGGIPEGMTPIYYGSTTLRDKLVAAGRPGVFFDPARFEFMALRHGYWTELLNQMSLVTTVGEFMASDEDPDELVFVRPTGDTKSLVGGVQTRLEWKEAMAISRNNTRGAKNHTPIQVSEPRNIEYEWRLFMVDGQVASASQYRAHGYSNLSPEVPDHVLAYGVSMAAKYSPARAFVLDVCELSSGGDYPLRVLETNCLNCAGFYKSDVVAIVRAITRMLEQ